MISVLFVCLGNICRSPMAETIFNKILQDNSQTGSFKVDSAGLLDYHKGEKADTRMRNHARLRGYIVTHISRPITSVDFEHFDYIIGMDDQNIRALSQLTKTPAQKAKIHKITDYSRQFEVDAVPDPYYGGDDGFIRVIDLLEDACSGLFHTIRKDN